MIEDPIGYRRALLHRLDDIQQIVLMQSHRFYSADAKTHMKMADARNHLAAAEREAPKLRLRLRPNCSLNDLREVRIWTDRWLKAFGKFIKPWWVEGIVTPTVTRNSRKNARKTLHSPVFSAENADLSFVDMDLSFMNPLKLDGLVLKSCKTSRKGREKRCETILVGDHPPIRNFSGHRKSLRRKLTEAEQCIRMALDEADGLPVELRTWLIESREKFIPAQRDRLDDANHKTIQSVRRDVAKWWKKFTDVLIALAAPQKPKPRTVGPAGKKE